MVISFISSSFMLMNSYLEIQKVIGIQKMESQSRHATLQDVPILNAVKVFFVKITCIHDVNYIPKANAIYKIKLYGNMMTCDAVSSECYSCMNIKNLKINTDYCESANTLEIDLVVKSRYNIMFNHFMLFDYNTNQGVFEMKHFVNESDILIPAKYHVTFYNENEYYNADDHN